MKEKNTIEVIRFLRGILPKSLFFILATDSSRAKFRRLVLA